MTQATSTFDLQPTVVLRLNFVPEFITAGGNSLSRREAFDQPGCVFDEPAHVLRIRHDLANNVGVQGKDGLAPPQYVTFDDPHLLAGTRLSGQYPSGVIG